MLGVRYHDDQEIYFQRIIYIVAKFIKIVINLNNDLRLIYYAILVAI